MNKSSHLRKELDSWRTGLGKRLIFHCVPFHSFLILYQVMYYAFEKQKQFNFKGIIETKNNNKNPTKLS